MSRSPRVRVKDIADRARVSPTTASVVLSGRADEFRIGASTRTLVLEVARQMGYVRPTSSRRNGRVVTPPLWGIFTPSDLDSGPITQFFQGAQKYVEDNQLQVDCVVVPFERGSLREKQRWLSAGFARGAIMFGLTDDDVAFIDETDFDIPVVLYNRTAAGCASVVVDDYGAGQQAMRHFLARGLRRFAIIGPNHTSRALSMRSIGFRDELGGSSETKIINISAEINDPDAFSSALVALPTAGGRTGIFVLNDQMIGAVMKWLQTSGVAVPDDAELISYGDSPINTVLRPSISSVAVPSELMSVECARTLHHAITNRGAMTDVTRSFDTHLVLRESSPDSA